MDVWDVHMKSLISPAVCLNSISLMAVGWAKLSFAGRLIVFLNLEFLVEFLCNVSFLLEGLQ